MALATKLTKGLRVRKNARPGLPKLGSTPQSMAATGLPKFTPFVAPDRPPAGFYDPAIDATVNASQRGFGDLQDQTAQDRLYLGTDTQQESDSIDRSSGRSLADLVQSRTRAGQDFASTTAERQRQYTNLGSSQAGAAQQQGVQSGGTLRAALEARQANQGREQGVAQQGLDRFNVDNSTSQTRVGQDTTLAHEDLTKRSQRAGGALDVRETIAGRENTQVGVDAAGARGFSAGQLGWQAPTAPKNEFRTPKVTDPVTGKVTGNLAYKVLKGKTRTLYLWPDGIKRPTKPA